MAKTAKNTAPAVEKKTKVNKGITKPKPTQKTVAKKAAPGGISGKYSGIKEKKPKATAAVSEAPKTDAQAAKPKLSKKQPRKSSTGRAVVKINSLPHGFYEEQLKGYFTQFGDVTNVKVVRSLKTGRSKGVAFVEFGVAEVAEIAAETMNNYLLFKNLIKTEYIPASKVKPGLFTKKVEVVIKPDGTQTVTSELITARKKEVRRLNVKPTDEQAKKRQKRLENKLKLKNKFLKKLGSDLNVESLVDGKVDLTTPVKAPSKAKKQNITVKVTPDAVVTVKETTAKPAGPAKKEKAVATPVAAAKVAAKKNTPKPKAETKKKGEKRTPTKKSPQKSSKAAEKEAKRAEWKKDHEKKLKAKKAAKSKEESIKVAEPTPVPAKKDKKAPAVKAAAAPVKAAKVQKVAATPATAKAVKATVAPKAKAPKGGKAATAKVTSPQKEKKTAGVKKTIEKKKPLKITPKKSVK